jgi:hypothetical protein
MNKTVASTAYSNPIAEALNSFNEAQQKLSEAQFEMHASKRVLVAALVEIGATDCLTVNLSAVRRMIR